MDEGAFRSLERKFCMKTYIFACVHNAGRSQMAAHFFNHFADPQRARAISAGTQPADSVNPVVVEAMREINIPIGTVTPQKLTADLCQGATQLFTMGCHENCPYVPGLKIEDWPFEDPKGQSIESVRNTRDKIHARVMQFIISENLLPPEGIEKNK